MHVHNYHVSMLPASAALDSNFMYLYYTLIQYYCVYTVQVGFGFGIIIVLPAVHEARVALWYPTSLPQSASM